MGMLLNEWNGTDILLAALAPISDLKPPNKKNPHGAKKKISNGGKRCGLIRSI
jgi:hypothetical protein